MEKLPQVPLESNEHSQEKILTSAEVLEALSRFAEGFTLGRELSDERGIYLREVTVTGEKEGETIEYQYMRKGDHGKQNVSSGTIISVIYYENDMPVGGERIAELDEETGEWKKL